MALSYSGIVNETNEIRKHGNSVRFNVNSIGKQINQNENVCINCELSSTLEIAFATSTRSIFSIT